MLVITVFLDLGNDTDSVVKIHPTIYLRLLHFSFCPLFIEFFRVILVNKIKEASGAQFHNTSPVHCIVCLPPQVKSPSIIIYPFTLNFPLPAPTSSHHTVVHVHDFLLFSIPLPTPHQQIAVSLQLSAYFLFLSLSLSCLLVQCVH